MMNLRTSASSAINTTARTSTIAAMMLYHQQRVFEFESNQHGKHHAKQALKDLRVCRVDHVAFDQPYCVQQQLPGGEPYDDGYYQREERDHRLLKSLIER